MLACQADSFCIVMLRRSIIFLCNYPQALKHPSAADLKIESAKMFTQLYKRHLKAHPQAMPLEFVSVLVCQGVGRKSVDVLALSELF